MKEKSIYQQRKEAREAAMREAEKRYPIYDNIPILNIERSNTKRRNKLFLPIDRLQVGQAFSAPLEDHGAILRTTTRRNKDGSGRRFVVRVNDFVWVWRVR